MSKTGEDWVRNFVNAASSVLQGPEALSSTFPTSPVIEEVLPAAEVEERGGGSSTADSEFDDPDSSPPDVKALKVALDRGRQSDILDIIAKLQDVNQQDDDGNTPLHLAFYYKNYQAAFGLLRKKGIDLNKPNKSEITLLSLVASYDDCLCVELLLQLGANIDKSVDLSADTMSAKIIKAAKLIDQIIAEVKGESISFTEDDVKNAEIFNQQKFSKIVTYKVNYAFKELLETNSELLYVPFLIKVLDSMRNHFNSPSVVHKEIYEQIIKQLEIQRIKFQESYSKYEKSGDKYLFKQMGDKSQLLISAIMKEEEAQSNFSVLEEAKEVRNKAIADYLAICNFAKRITLKDEGSYEGDAGDAGGSASSAPHSTDQSDSSRAVSGAVDDDNGDPS